MSTSEDEIVAEEETMIRHANDVLVMTVRKGIAKLKIIQDCVNQHRTLDVKYLRENGRPILKIDLEPKKHE